MTNAMQALRDKLAASAKPSTPAVPTAQPTAPAPTSMQAPAPKPVNSAIAALQAKMRAAKGTVLAPSATPAPAKTPVQQQLAQILARKAAAKEALASAIQTGNPSAILPFTTAELTQASSTLVRELPTAPAQSTASSSLPSPASSYAPLEGELVPKSSTAGGSGTARTELEQNERQDAAVAEAMKGSHFVMIGSAGTGKTTTERRIVQALSDSLCAEMNADPEKFQPSKYIIVCAFTRRAVRNTHKALSVLGTKYTACCKTVHKALDYKPVIEEKLDDEGNFYTSRTFQPHVTAEAPNTDARIILVDEASMLGYNILFRQLLEGHPNARFVFIGDLNQLRPVMDDPTLAYALASLPVIELTKVYRQALDSPIVEFQYTFTLAGKVPNFADLMRYNTSKAGLQFHAMGWPKFADTSKYAGLFTKTIIVPSFRAGSYNPEDSVILIPYNKEGTFGAIELNLEIAEFLGQERNATVFEVIAGYQRRYYAVGDFVMHDRRECVIIDITLNTDYKGLTPKAPSHSLSRHGYYLNSDTEVDTDMFGGALPSTVALQEIMLQSMNKPEDEEDESSATRKASHTITVKDRETGNLETVDVNKDIADMEFSYAMTVHKSQGSEWRKVYFILHACHKNVTRELLYTGMTRAREELVVFYSKGHSVGTNLDNSSLAKAINRQEIAGKTWQEKAAVYRAKLNNGDIDKPIDMFSFPPAINSTGD